MLKNRIMPCLLLQDGRLVKTVAFKDPVYVGDPINVIRIFNEKEVDEIVVLDIGATVKGNRPPFELISKMASECYMPLAYGGGISCLEDIKKLINSGVEKVVINSCAVANPNFVKEASGSFGSQSIIISIDVKRDKSDSYKIFTHNGSENTGLDPVEFSKTMETNGAGEIFLNSIEKDGTQEGYDIELIKKVTSALSIPVIACGGAARLSDLNRAIKEGGASAVAAGSLFVFYGKSKAVLISYPSASELEDVFK